MGLETKIKGNESVSVLPESGSSNYGPNMSAITGKNNYDLRYVKDKPYEGMIESKCHKFDELASYAIANGYNSMLKKMKAY